LHLVGILFPHINWHTLNIIIKETEIKSKRPDTRGNPFGMKWTMKIGLWNVRTFTEYGKLKQVEKEMTNYKLDIMGLSEIQWRDKNTKWKLTDIFRCR